jgi:hypothetical protein
MKIHKAESMKKEKKKNENIRIDKGKVKGWKSHFHEELALCHVF